MDFKDNQIQYWLDELGLECGESLTLDEKGSCILQAGDDISFLLSADKSNKAYALSAYLADLSTTKKEEMLTTALSFNLHQMKTQGAAIALDKEHNALYLCYTNLISDCSYQTFKNILDNVIDKAREIQQEFKLIGHTKHQEETLTPAMMRFIG